MDTRFLVEYFFTDDENFARKAQERITKLIRSKEGILPAIVISELVRVVCRRRGEEESRMRYLSLIKSGLKIAQVDEGIAYRAGILRCKYRDVPLGDCIIAAIAERYGAAVLTDDPHFDEMEEVRRIWV